MDIFNSGLTTTNGRLYFLNLTTRERLEIQFVPSELNHDRQADWGDIQVISRNIPQYQYSGGKTKLDFVLDFHADEQSRTSVIQRCRWLEAMTYNDGGKKPVPKIALVFGSLYGDLEWVVDRVSYKLTNFSKPHGFLPQQAILNISLLLDLPDNPTWDIINPALETGEADGFNPISLGIPRNDDDGDSQFFLNDLSNENNFKEVLKRALTRLRISGSALTRVGVNQPNTSYRTYF